MGLNNILQATKQKKELDAEATEDYVKAHLDDFRDLIAY